MAGGATLTQLLNVWLPSEAFVSCQAGLRKGADEARTTKRSSSGASEAIWVQRGACGALARSGKPCPRAPRAALWRSSSRARRTEREPRLHSAIRSLMPVTSAMSSVMSLTVNGWRHIGQDTFADTCSSCASVDFKRQLLQNACPHTVRTGCQNGSQHIGHAKLTNAGSSACCCSLRKNSSRVSRRQMLKGGNSPEPSTSGLPNEDPCLGVLGFEVDTQAGLIIASAVFTDA